MDHRTPSSTAPRWQTWGAAAAVGLVAWFVFRGVAGGALLQWDDDINLQYNVHLHEMSWANLRWMFTDASYMRRYVPLGWLCFAADYRFFGPGPRSFHLTNLLFYSADAVLVFFLIGKLLRALPETRAASRSGFAVLASMAGALLWAVHPLRVETVAWASGMYCQAGFFLLLSMLAYLEAAASAPRTLAYRLMLAASILAFVLSLITYPLALTYSGVLVILDVWVLDRFAPGPRGWRDVKSRRIWIEKVPFFAVTAAVLGVTVWARFHPQAVFAPPAALGDFGVGSRILQAFYVWAYYLWKPLFPYNLSPVYTTLVWLNPRDWIFTASLVTVVGITVLLSWRRRHWPKTLALWLCHLALLLPMLGLTEHPHFTNDRYSFLVSIPFSVAIAVVLLRTGSYRLGRILALAAACAAIVVGGRASAAQVRIWRDSETLFRYMLTKLGPDSYRAEILRHLARLFNSQGRQAEAVAAYEEAVRVMPAWAVAHYELGSTLMERGQIEEGIVHFQEALHLAPDMLEARYDLTDALFKSGRLPEAIGAVQELIRLQPSTGAYYDLAVLYSRLGRLAEAGEACDQALLLDPANAHALALKQVLAEQAAK